MRKTIFLFLLLSLPAMLFAQADARAILDKAVAAIKADAGVSMDFTITLYDFAGDEQYDDKGVLKIDGEKYALLSDQMKLWCDGETQWSYIAANNEIYISEPNADDARTFSPLHIMELYKEGYKSSVDKKLSSAKSDAVVLVANARGLEIKKVTIMLDKQTARPQQLEVVYENGTSATIKINSYKGKCKFSTKDFRCREKDFRGVEFVDMR
jgi:outer membrane lipoprotein-sorting protein